MNNEHTASRPHASGTDERTIHGVRWLRLAVVYLLVGVVLGIVMGATHDFTLRPVHAHLNLLGWTTLALAGLVYAVYPQAATTRCARVHFWLYVTALPVMMLALAGLLLGHAGAVPALVAAQFAILGGVLAFALNVFLNLAPRRAPVAAVEPPAAACLPVAGRA